jgi:hypothetical protein
MAIDGSFVVIGGAPRLDWSLTEIKAGDVKALYPDMPTDKCEAFLTRHGAMIRSSMLRHGLKTIQYFMGDGEKPL